VRAGQVEEVKANKDPETPVVAVKCAKCHTTCASPTPCPGCSDTAYCSGVCLKAHRLRHWGLSPKCKPISQAITTPTRPQIRVSRIGWGDAQSENVAIVLTEVCTIFQPYFRRFPSLEISHGDRQQTLKESGPNGEVRIKLNVVNNVWVLFVSQFGNEMGHLLCGRILCGRGNYENPNYWFEEVMCEAAALYALQRMGESWAKLPPYKEWDSYHEMFAKYRQSRITAGCIMLPPDEDLKAWFASKEATLREKPELHVILPLAVLLLPILEQEPYLWKALGSLNTVQGDSTRSFRQYLRDWHDSLGKPTLQVLVTAVADKLGVSDFIDLAPSVPPMPIALAS